MLRTMLLLKRSQNGSGLLLGWLWACFCYAQEPAPVKIEQLIDAGKLEEAHRALAAVPESPRKALLEAMILHKQKRFRESLARLAPIEEQLKNDVRFCMLAGLNLVSLGRAPEAGPYFWRATAADPHNGRAHYYLGMWLLTHGHAAEAEMELRRAMQLEPAHLEAFTMFALALEQQGKVEDALRAYRAAARLYEQRGTLSETPYLYAGRLLQAQERYEESARELERAVQVNPQSSEAWLALSKTREKLGDAQAALQAARQAVRLAPADAPAHYYLARLCRKLGLLREAEQALQTYEQLKARSQGH